MLVKENMRFSEKEFKKSEKLLSYICKEEKEIFSTNVRLFPMNFPPKQDPE